MANSDIKMGEAQSKKVMAHLWASDMYGLVREMECLGDAVADLRRRKQGPRAVAPDLVRAYELALAHQNELLTSRPGGAGMPRGTSSSG